MKQAKLLVLILFTVALLLAGCDRANTDLPETTGTTAEPQAPTTTVTEPRLSWVEAVGMPWDTEGALLEIPLTVPDGLHYTSAMNYDGDLLLWSLDEHLIERKTLELCLIDLESGEVLAQKDIPIVDYVDPQVLDGTLYVCDNMSGNIYGLDKTLEIVLQWQIEPSEGNWYMGAGEKVYQLNDSLQLRVTDLSSGTSAAVLAGDPETWMSPSQNEAAVLHYYSADTGALKIAILDLLTGEVTYDPFGYDFDSVSKVDESWLCVKYTNQNSYYFANGENQWWFSTDSDYLELLPNERLLLTDIEGANLRLYNLQGELISQCQIYEGYRYYGVSCLIWSDAFNGYFIWLSSEGWADRLLFWDVTVSGDAEPLAMKKIPEPSEEESLLKNRAEELSLEFGLTVLVSTDCDTVFDEFTATLATDYDTVNAALDILESALSAYPEGFLAQLRYGFMHGITIQLVCDLQATGGGREGDGYSAFTQNLWDQYLMVMDIDDSGVETYYHEFSHIIDSYLEWDASQREDALFSEEGWYALNPDWFDGYTYDYSREQTVLDYSWFIDSYSTINPTEDRARVMEKAMSDYEYWYFSESPGLQGKLSYYCECIRDAFDTDGWPETTLWEQYN